ncbi:MAG: autoinducer 2 ABC transporter substrate-binding protein LsrB [Chloroflexi bacterium HGW-Chloroflexi-4]|jgi:AI-2 transport system substrate-binding protein|nr:MAG: autoinducer 2 ABC transporter substrate-binding protein LsrB [Chloroflexi bacterium HGW-Chloroflexi-4]
MKKKMVIRFLIILIFLSGFLGACQTPAAPTPKSSLTKIVFIPKLTGVGFFESGGKGALEMGEQLGITVTYDGPNAPSVNGQIEYIQKYMDADYDAIVISSLSPDGLCEILTEAMENGTVVLTWDSDVNPECRLYYINQGTPVQLGRMLVGMVADQMNNPKSSQNVAFFYSSPTVTDQNQWVSVAKAIIATEYPSWNIVTTQYGYQNVEKSLETATNIFTAYPDLDAIICPDANALPAAAEAAEKLGIDEKVIITGFSTPNVMRPFVKNGTVNRFGLWDVVEQGKLSIFIANELINGRKFSIGEKVEVSGIGTVVISSNKVQGYEYESVGNGIILLPDRVIFNNSNIDDFDF